MMERLSKIRVFRLVWEVQSKLNKFFLWHFPPIFYHIWWKKNAQYLRWKIIKYGKKDWGNSFFNLSSATHFSIHNFQNIFLIWISRSFKKEASNKTISYFDQSFRFYGLWLILARDLGRSGQDKSWGTENREREHVILFF